MCSSRILQNIDLIMLGLDFRSKFRDVNAVHCRSKADYGFLFVAPRHQAWPASDVFALVDRAAELRERWRQ